MKITDTHVYFWRGAFSNWHICEFVEFVCADTCLKFSSTEQAFMWHKAEYFGDFKTREKIELENDPQKVKKLGREIKNFDEERWLKVRLGFMILVNKLKYSQNPDLLKLLLETGGKTLTEASPYDTIWGVGLREDDPLILDEKNWRGLNLLGIALMEVRENLKNN